MVQYKKQNLIQNPDPDWKSRAGGTEVQGAPHILADQLTLS